MLKNYFKTAWRSLVRDRQFSLLNLLGLSTGLACTLLIFLWVTDETKVDKFHEKDSRLYQVIEREQLSNGIVVRTTTSGLTAEVLKNEMPEVEYSTAVIHYSWFPRFAVSSAADKKLKATGQFADKNFFNVFSYQLIEGNKDQVLNDKKSIVISEALASKFFNTSTNVVGKVLEWELSGYKQQVTVSGVFKNIPASSSQQFDFVLSFEAFKEISPGVLEWGNNGTNTYVVLKKDADVDQFNKKIAGILKTKKPDTGRNQFVAQFSSLYLHGKFDNGVQAGGRIEYVRLFTIVAIFILIIACINFMNLSTAKASRRLKEVGVKKVVGAGRGSLILQYMGESVLMAFISLIISIVLVALLLTPFNTITGKDIQLQWDFNLVLTALGITLLTGLISGSYPAFYISGFKPVAVLKGKLKTTAGELWIRKGLVVFQFTLSVIFIVGVVVVYQQIQLIQTKNLGYNKENTIYFAKEGRIQETPESFIAELKKIPGVINASASDHRFAGGHNTTGGVDWPGKIPAQDFSFEIVNADYDMIEMLDMKMKEGRSFSKNFGADSTKIIFNEAAIEQMGLKDPVGKIINLWGNNLEILGVVKNFHYESLHQTVKPLFIRLNPKHAHYIMAKMAAGQDKKVLAGIKTLYGQFNPGSPFDYKFLNEDYQALYASEQKISVLSKWFAALAILISCLGLFGLAAFTAQKRQKEIGIRKVVGASTGSVVMMLSKDFLKLVLIAVFIAFPIAWWTTNQWLNEFAYRVNLNAGIFIVAGAATILITLITISFQSIKAAIANPVKSLRSE